MKKVALSFLVVAASATYVWQQNATRPPDDLMGTALPADGILTGSIPRRTTGSADTDATAIAPPKTPAFAPTSPIAEIRAAPPLEGAGANGAASPSPPMPPPKSPLSSAAPILMPTSGGVSIVVETMPATPAREARLPRPRPVDRVIPVNFTQTPQTPVTVAASGGYVDGAYTGPVTDAYYGPIQIQAIIQGHRLVNIKVLQYPSDRRTSIRINRIALPMLRDEVVSAQSANVDIVSGATLTSEAFVRSIGGALRQARP